MKQDLSTTQFAPVRATPALQALFFALLLLMPVIYANAEYHPISTPKSDMKIIVQKRKMNHGHPMAISLAPKQKGRWGIKRRAKYACSHGTRTIHSRGKLGKSRRKEAITPRRNFKTTTKLRSVLYRLKSQLGKPYSWGDASPNRGFDCSGLVFYAFNPVLKLKHNLPRTSNGMYLDKSLSHVAQSKLKMGDLVFFSIRQRSVADHVGVYLGHGRFIEAPRTGLNVRISHLSNPFWQSHYLGARRVL